MIILKPIFIGDTGEEFKFKINNNEKALKKAIEDLNLVVDQLVTTSDGNAILQIRDDLQKQITALQTDLSNYKNTNNAAIAAIGVSIEELQELSHTHDNMTILDELSSTDGELTFMGEFITPRIQTTNSSTVVLTYDTTAKTITATAKISNYSDNSVKVVGDGIYSPILKKYETETVKWTTERSAGEDLLSLFNSGTRFSHTSSSWSNMANSSEANAWNWNNTLKSFVQSVNSGTFNGFITLNNYDYYTHIATIKSTDSDNDSNGLVIGYIIDSEGKPRTLSIICQRGSDFGSYKFGLWYDYYLPDQTLVANLTPGNTASSGWSSAPTGITVRVEKNGPEVICTCSNWNSTTLNESSKLTINLDDYSWGGYFRNKVKYGYCNISQASSYFTNIVFNSDASSTDDTAYAYVKVSSKADNGIKIEEDGLWSSSGVEISAEANNVFEKKADGYYVDGSTRLSQEQFELLNLFSQNSDSSLNFNGVLVTQEYTSEEIQEMINELWIELEG